MNWILLMIMAICFFSAEHFTRKLLKSIITHSSELSFEHSSQQKLKLETHGNGMAAEMIRGILSGFEFDHRYTVSGSFKRCEPKLKHMKNHIGLSEQKITACWFTALFSAIIFETSMMYSFIHKAICDYFFSKTAFQRKMFLYFRLLQSQKFRRDRFIRSLRRLQYAKELSESIDFPPKPDFIERVFRLSPKFNCSVCKTKLKYSKTSKYFHCKYCNYAWCLSCDRFDRQNHCLICNE